MRMVTAASTLTLLLMAGTASAQNLVANGSFETSPLAPGAYRDMLVGSSDLPGWTIVGVPNTHISQVDSAYAGNPGYTFPAQDGRQWLDLAGYSNNAMDGIQQSVATTVGQLYAFSFWLGNVSGGAFGTQSAVDVAFSSGGANFSCVNTTQTFNLTWQQCSQTFRATSASTTFTIINRDPSSDYSNAIDNVSLVAAQVAGVPEPATWGLMLVGFGAAGFAMRRHKVRTKVSFA